MNKRQTMVHKTIQGKLQFKQLESHQK